jgi:hypothetical protein
MRQRTRAFLVTLGITLSSALLSTAGRALNWEGHDDWMLDDTLFRSFTDLVPKAPPAKLPTCEERARRAAENVYEQVPLPGINCLKSEPGE